MRRGAPAPLARAARTGLLGGALVLLACDRAAEPHAVATARDAVAEGQAAGGDVTPPNAWHLIANGRDTLAEERLEADASAPHSVRRLQRVGETQRLTLRAGPHGAHWEYVVVHDHTPARLVRQRVIVGRQGLIVLRGTPLGGVVSVDTLRVSGDVLPWLDGSLLVLEQLAHRLRDTTATERMVTVVPVASPTHGQSVRLVRGGADTLHVHHPDGHWWVRLDARGHVREAAAPSRRLVLRAAPVTDATASRAHADTPPISHGHREEAVRVRSADGTPLAGTLRLPACRPAAAGGGAASGDGACVSARWPAVLLLSGAGPQTRDLGVPGFVGYAAFAELADALAAAGIASLRLDDRGAGGSGGAAFLHDAATERADARAALAWLGAHPAIDPDAIAVVGHSDGGVRALELAAPGAPAVRAVVTLGAPARSGRSLAALQRARWQRAAARTEHRQTARDAVGADVEGADAVVSDVALDELAARDPWLRDWLARDPAHDVTAVAVPVLVVHGTTDGQVPVADADALVALLRARATGTARVTRRLVPGVNHLLLRDSSGDPRAYGALRERTLAPAVVAATVPWLRATLR